MKKITATIIVLSLFYSLSAQEDSTKLKSVKEEKNRIYKTWISLINSSDKVKGVFYDVQDSSITVSNSASVKDYSEGKFELSYINYKTIDVVKTRVMNKVGKGAAIGMGIGFITGVLIGIISGDDNPEEVVFPTSAGQKALSGGIFLAIGGAGIGALVGSIKIKIPINGNPGNFNRSKSRLKKYSFR